MLVLSRKQTQSIIIDDKIEITVLQIRGNCVRIGINAPQDVPIVRSELPPEPWSDRGPCTKVCDILTEGTPPQATSVTA
jgi:carbon storage regulator CsrA